MKGNAAPGLGPPVDCWAALYLPDCPLVIEQRSLGGLASISARLAAKAPFERKAAGLPEAAVAALGVLPSLLRADILALARRFAAFMHVETVGLRLEAITTNACRRVHADWTDLRLICTYHGPGTDYLPSEAEPGETGLHRMVAGDIGLFKGRLYAEGHEPCLHRSPAIEGTGATRLVLVIDTELDEEKSIELQMRQKKG